MKAGRVIPADEQEARERATKIIDDARAEAQRLLDDANKLANELVSQARTSSERVTAQAKHVETSVGRTTPKDGTLAIETRLGSDNEGSASKTWSVGRITPMGGETAIREGEVDEVIGLVIRATVPGVSLGEIVKIDRREQPPLVAEVVGFRDEQAVLVPLGELAGIAAASAVWRTGAPLSITCGDEMLGRVLDGIGQPVDGGPELTGETWAVDRAAPPALSRPPISAPQPTGVRAIDAMLSLGRGQRIGLFAAAGVGKSTLLGQIARNATADVIVHCQVGERGRELGEMLGDELAGSRGRVVAVCATSDAPPLVRLRAVHVATAIAEWFRERRGASVLLLVDSLTRVARAQREVGLSAGEPPARHGYPPSVFALLPRLIERTGATKSGVITAIYTVLVAGNDLDEPIADEVRGLVDGHIVLDRRLASRGHFPPIDVVASTSRLMNRVVDAQHAEAAARVRERLAIYEEHRDLITLGAYQAGRDKKVDEAVTAYPAIERVLRQGRDEPGDWDHAVSALLTLARAH